ncbi:hypothetical protein [Desulfovibrio cuneatus]|uniref:hypothetical protein n=1 Tax=Desulfovibrio cuneatus TaxID=159728 RepID=UPI0003FA93F4|nr:hypothetical protein [Desulfovibrio cuneatus]
MRALFCSLILVCLLHTPTWGATPLWLQTLPADAQRTGYTQHVFPLPHSVGVIINGNFESRPLFRLNNQGLLVPGMILNTAPARQVVVGENSILLCNNNFILNQETGVSLFSTSYEPIATVATPFTETAGTFVHTAPGKVFFALAGTRADGTNELWAIDAQGQVLWRKPSLAGTDYTASFGIGQWQHGLVLAAAHRHRGLELALFSLEGTLQQVVPVPQFPATVRYPQVIVPTLFFGDFMLTAGFTSDKQLRVGLVHLPSGVTRHVDIPTEADAANFLRLVGLSNTEAAIALGDSLYVIQAPHGSITRTPSPLPKAFLVCLAPLPNGDIALGGSLQLPEAPWPAPFVARFTRKALLPPEQAMPVATWPAMPQEPTK